jgi:hypothetical protein
MGWGRCVRIYQTGWIVRSNFKNKSRKVRIGECGHRWR